MTAPNPNSPISNPQSAKVLADSMTAGLFNVMAETEAVHPVSYWMILNDGPADDPRDRVEEWTELADEHWTGSHKEMRQRANTIMRTQTFSVNPKLGTIKLGSQKARSKTLGHMKTPHEFQSVQAIPEITAKGRVATEEDQQHRPDVVAIHKVQRNLRIGESEYKAQAIVRETKDGSKTTHRFYLHRIDPVANRKTGSPYCVPSPCGENSGPAGQKKSNT
jgi:hypothetical protein